MSETIAHLLAAAAAGASALRGTNDRPPLTFDALRA